MKYSDYEPKDPTEIRLRVDECQPGEIYECVIGDKSRSTKKPGMQSLRLCVIKEGDISLFNLEDGMQNAAISFNVSLSPSKLYVHRPDIQLTVVVK
jgi:hypothetical protein